MKERPIIFSTQMVQAILEGRKTMTRRIVKFPKDFTGESVYDNSPYGLKYSNSKDTLVRMVCHYGEPGDQLWVKETFARVSMGVYAYKAEAPDKKAEMLFKWTPSIFMPRKASRINLLIKSISVERLQDISIEDALKEGINHRSMNYPPSEFAWLWKSINGEGSWEQNPWVWVIEFERIDP